MKIKNWCYYCHDEISEGEHFVIFEGETYHPFCFKQKNTYFNSMEFEEDE